MAKEIEIKCTVAPEDIAKITAHPLVCDWPARSQALQNTYYDTPDLDLHARRIALRFRKKGDNWLLTVKTAEASHDGLAIRNEWEVAAQPGIFDFSHVDHPAIRTLLEAWQPRLMPIFTTDFQRETRQIIYGQSRIEMAIDQGFIESHGQREALCEIELELQAGELADLNAFASELRQSLPISPSDISKALRGYRCYAQIRALAAI